MTSCRPLFRLSFYLLLALALASCGARTPEAMLDDYAQRVARVLETQVEIVPLSWPALPPRRERRLPVEDLRQGFVEVFRLRHCDLLPLLGERNSSMGKLQRPSQRLVYELKFLRELQQCHAALTPDNAALKLQLEQILAIKQRDMPAVIWNALYLSEEMESQFSRGGAALALQDNGAFRNVLRALSALDVYSHVDAHSVPAMPALDQIESHFAQLYANPFGAQWLASVALLSARLEQVANIIEQRLQRKPLCYFERPNNQARVLQNVFLNVYAAEVQPYLARVEQHGGQWVAVHDDWMRRLPAPAGMQAYRLAVLDGSGDASVWRRFQLARERHTQAWQTVLRQCGLMPGSAATGS